MEVVNQLKGVFQKFRRFPSEFVVTNPSDKVFQSFSDKLGIKYLFNLAFDVVVHDDRRWGRLLLSNKGVACCGFKSGYMKNWVAFH